MSIERIAAALERQVAQHDESVERNLALRADNINRHDREHEVTTAQFREAIEGIVYFRKMVDQLWARILVLEGTRAAGAGRSPCR